MDGLTPTYSCGRLTLPLTEALMEVEQLGKASKKRKALLSETELACTRKRLLQHAGDALKPSEKRPAVSFGDALMELEFLACEMVRYDKRPFLSDEEVDIAKKSLIDSMVLDSVARPETEYICVYK
jgi:hypothetical protein